VTALLARFNLLAILLAGVLSAFNLLAMLGIGSWLLPVTVALTVACATHRAVSVSHHQ